MIVWNDGGVVVVCGIEVEIWEVVVWAVSVGNMVVKAT